MLAPRGVKSTRGMIMTCRRGFPCARQLPNLVCWSTWGSTTGAGSAQRLTPQSSASHAESALGSEADELKYGRSGVKGKAGQYVCWAYFLPIRRYHGRFMDYETAGWIHQTYLSMLMVPAHAGWERDMTMRQGCLSGKCARKLECGW